MEPKKRSIVKIHAAFFHKMNVNGYWDCQAPKRHWHFVKKSMHFKSLFTSNILFRPYTSHILFKTIKSRVKGKIFSG